MKAREEEGARPLNPEDPSRRKMVKALVGGVTVLAAYYTLPTNWSKLLISQISLPAHAATSGTDSETEPDTPEPEPVTYNIMSMGL